MKLSSALSILLLLLLCSAQLFLQGESRYIQTFMEDHEEYWPWNPFSTPQQKAHHKTKPFISEDCLKAKLALSDCVKEKLASHWYSKPLVKDCCDPIAKHKKACPKLVAGFDELLIPYYIKKVCHASAPAAGPSHH